MKSRQQRGVHAVHSNRDSEDELQALLGSIEVYSMKNSKSNVIWITPEVEGKLVKMELDTGSAVSILP